MNEALIIIGTMLAYFAIAIPLAILIGKAIDRGMR